MGLLCALTLAFYRRIALTDLVLPGVDAFTYFYPYRAYAAEVVRSGQIPLWNPYLFLGVPFVANAQSAVFYPLNLALCWLPAPRLVAWSIVLHVAMAALFAYLYARHARLSPLPAFLGASAFAFGGFVSGQVEHVNQLNVSAWFPLLLLLWDLAVREGEYGASPLRGDGPRAKGEYGASPLRGGRPRAKVRWPTLLGMGGVIGAGILAGHAQSSYISLFGLGVYALLPTLPDLWPVRRGGERGASGGYGALGEHGASPLRGGVRRLGTVVLWLGVASLVGVGLAAVQILPTVELSRLSIRSGGLEYREAVAFSLRPLPRLLRYTFLPPWGGNLADAFGGDFYTEYLAYVGLGPLLLVVGWLGGWVVGLICSRAHHPHLAQEDAVVLQSSSLVQNPQSSSRSGQIEPYFNIVDVGRCVRFDGQIVMVLNHLAHLPGRGWRSAPLRLAVHLRPKAILLTQYVGKDGVVFFHLGQSPPV